MDAPHPAQPVLVAHQPHIGHGYLAAVPDGDIHHSAVPGQIYGHFPADLAGESRHGGQQRKGGERVRLHAQLIQIPDLLQEAISDALYIAVDLLGHMLPVSGLCRRLLIIFQIVQVHSVDQAAPGAHHHHVVIHGGRGFHVATQAHFADDLAGLAVD